MTPQTQERQVLEARVEPEAKGIRLDAWLARRFPDFSRARWQQWIRAGCVAVDGAARAPNLRLRGGESVRAELPPPQPAALEPEPIPLDILYEDEDVLVLNKPAGLVVHPAAGHAAGTLVNALLHHCAQRGAPLPPGVGGELRPGIVHRLDKDTSGAMVVAKSEPALRGLAEQFHARRVEKRYLALVWGRPAPPVGTVCTLIGRSVHNRKKMSARVSTGRPAVTRYALREAFADVSLLEVRTETGRTHQIRVHLAHIGHPVVGDRQYGRARRCALPAPAPRQMLHAERLAFEHPRTGERLEFVAPLPADMRQLLEALRAAKGA